MSELHEVLTKIGFSEDELKIYEVVVAFNFRTIGQISSYTNLDLSKVTQSCEALVSKNFLKKIVHKSPEAAVYIPLTPKIAITANVSQNLSNKLEKLSSLVNELWGEAQSHIDSDLQTIITSVKDGLDKLIKTISSYRDDHSEAIERSNSSFQNHLRLVTDKTSDIFQDKINIPLTNLSKELEGLSRKITEVCDNSLINIEKANSNHEKQILETSSVIKEELTVFTDSIALFSSGRISSLGKQTEDDSGETTEKGAELISEMNSTIQNVFKVDEDNVKQIKEQFPSDLLAAYNEQKMMLVELSNHNYTEFVSNIDSTVSANEKSIEEAILASEKMFDFIEEAQKTKLVDLQNEMLTAIKSVQSEAVSNLEKIFTDTSASLKSENTTVSKNIKSFKKSLDKDLNVLKANLVGSLNEKFIAVETQLTGFVESLKHSSENNVSDITSSVEGLKEFVSEYLKSVQTGFGGNLDQLQKDVNHSLAEINKSSSEEISSSVSDSNDSFNNIIISFDESIKLATGEFETAVSVREEEQNLKMIELENETNNLNSDLKKVREEIDLFLETQLENMKKSSIEELRQEITTSIDNFSNEFTRFNESMDQQFKSFYNNFHEKSSGLRQEVPERIEGLLVDQSDRLDNFRRDFQRIMGHATDTLNKFLTSFSPDGKKIDKKDVPVLHGDVTRAVQDFKYFDSQISEHFGTSIDNTQELKSQFLNEINQIIQNELSDLEIIVTTQSEKVQSTTKEYIGGLSQNTNIFMDAINRTTDETISELESNISTKMVANIQQPMKDILSKAHTLSTGTQAGEQENRILLSQNELIKEIRNHLKTLESNVSKVSKEQKVSNKSLSKSLNQMIKEASTSIDKTLNKSITNANIEVENTVVTKTEEIAVMVNQKNNDLSTATKSNLGEMDTSLGEFNREFKSILSETTDELSRTIDTASTSQEDSVSKTLDQMKTATDDTISILNTTKTSLNENVAKPMESIKADVENLISKYDQTVAGEKMMLQSEISKFFDSSSGYIEEISKLKNSFKKVKTAYTKELETIGKKLNTDLHTYLEDNLNNRKEGNSAFKQELVSSIVKIDENNTSFIVNLYDQVNTQLSMLQVEINENLNGTRNNIDNEVTNIIETVRSDIVSAADGVTSIVSDEKVTIPSKLNEISSSLNSLSGAQDSEFMKAKENFLMKISDEILSRGDEWKTSIQKTYNNQNSSLNTLFDEFDKQIGDHRSTGKENVTNQINKIPDTIEETLEAAAKSMYLLNQISKGSIDLDPKFPELSYFDTSKEAILANLNGVLSRTKSSLTIVSPTISWLNEGLIDSFSRVSVKIITDLDQHTPQDSKILELFKNHGINLDLRKLDKNRFRGDINMIMATRDREEVILAKLPNSPDAYAFVSQDEVFIEKFAELFAPFQTMPRIS